MALPLISVMTSPALIPAFAAGVLEKTLPTRAPFWLGRLKDLARPASMSWD
jgi:hypothetical protein